MGTTKELLEGVATFLAGAGLGLTFTPSGTYTAGQTGILFMHVPPTPNRVVVLNLVDRDDDPSMPLGSKMLQVRGRGLPNNPLDVGELLDQIFTVLHGKTNWVIGAQTVIQCNRRISAPMGKDESNRWERADQYYLDVDAPPTALRPDGGSW